MFGATVSDDEILVVGQRADFVDTRNDPAPMIFMEKIPIRIPGFKYSILWWVNYPHDR
jgi:hypothetical protein